MTPPAPYAARPRRGRLLADLLCGWGLLAAAVCLGGIGSLAGLLSLLQSDACPSPTRSRLPGCDESRIVEGVVVAGLAHWVVLAIAVVAVVRRSPTPRSVCWIPVLATLIGAATFVAGEIWASSGVPR